MENTYTATGLRSMRSWRRHFTNCWSTRSRVRCCGRTVTGTSLSRSRICAENFQPWSRYLVGGETLLRVDVLGAYFLMENRNTFVGCVHARFATFFLSLPLTGNSRKRKPVCRNRLLSFFLLNLFKWLGSGILDFVDEIESILNGVNVEYSWTQRT